MVHHMLVTARAWDLHAPLAREWAFRPVVVLEDDGGALVAAPDASLVHGVRIKKEPTALLSTTLDNVEVLLHVLLGKSGGRERLRLIVHKPARKWSRKEGHERNLVGLAEGTHTTFDAPVRAQCNLGWSTDVTVYIMQEDEHL